MDYENIRVETTESRFAIVLDRPGKPNPIDERTLSELDDALDVFEAGASPVLTITGTETAFATGADITSLERWVTAERWDEMMQFVRRGQLVVDRIATLDAPTIAAVNGYALGGGLELALACDLRFAGESATLGFPEIDLGLLPAWGGTQRLPAVVGRSTATDLLLTGRRLSAEEAAAVGLVDRVSPDDELETAAADYAATLAEKPRQTLRYVLEATRVGQRDAIETGLAYELMNNMLSAFTDDARSRTRAFLDG